MIKDIENKTHEERLREVDMLNIEERRQKGDIITFQNCIKGHYKGNGELLFLLAQRNKTQSKVIGRDYNTDTIFL